MFSSFSTRDRLRRSRSTRSMRRSRAVGEPDSVDPELAKIHAAAAASRAMRSSGRSSTDSRNSYDRLGGPANVAIPRRRPNSSLQTTDDSYSGVTMPVAPPATPLQTPESNGISQSHFRENSAALPPITEFKGLDGRDSSVPSSYRRLRKARSMFSTRQRLSQLGNGTPNMPHPNSPGPDFSPEFVLPRTLRNSKSFAHGPRAVRHSESQDTAIQLARSQFLEENGVCEGQSRRPSFLLSRRKREHKPFRKTFRMTSDGGIGTSPSSGHFSSRLAHKRSRTFSASIKQGLRRVFGRSKASDRPSEPRVESSPDCLNESAPMRDSIDINAVKNIIEDLSDSAASSPLRVIQASPSRASICTSDSRTTSWTTSTAANTVTTRRTGHRQSLSLIEEQGGSNPGLPQIPAQDIESRQSPSRKRSGARNFNPWFNTQDLYTALMQQISRNSAQNPEEEVSLGSVPEHRVIPERASSIRSHRSKRTVRRVPSVESSTSPGSFATARCDSTSPQKHQRPAGVVRPLRVSQFSRGPASTRLSTEYSQAKSPCSTFIIGSDSDEETGSVIIARPSSKAEPDSPTSIYSRTISGDTPTKGGRCMLSVLDAGEPGTATIFASERTAWSSPSHRGESQARYSVQPSADWQQWMSSQIERIEQTSPPRQHMREDAQYQDDDEVFTDMIRHAPPPVPDPVLTNPAFKSDIPDDVVRPPADAQALPPNNFSRPFSRSSSVRTILSARRIEPEEATKIPASDLESEATTNCPQPIPSWATAQIPDPPLSPMRVRTSNVIRIPESPTPPQRNGLGLLKRTWTQEQYRRYSARRPLNGTANSLRSIRSHRDFQGLNNENTRQEQEHDDMMNEYHKLQEMPATMSSKRMVDMFLDSRRRQMGMEPVESPSRNGNNAIVPAFI
ncbi:uncharacterized protein N7483_002713 [Penicillium malachiteum]|uniref:uncharacterized protein n=1 Tax=Penicillium malachiteum TaxID=1324776 RepID=UPI00254958EA|nr:uncharacterized protein N7483_002713 [Penicillium malachiteum]KAJ5737588.1 hypothetical protein N7483_002713 [Penicillium malachiteum]